MRGLRLSILVIATRCGMVTCDPRQPVNGTEVRLRRFRDRCNWSAEPARWGSGNCPKKYASRSSVVVWEVVIELGRRASGSLAQHLFDAAAEQVELEVRDRPCST